MQIKFCNKLFIFKICKKNDRVIYFSIRLMLESEIKFWGNFFNISQKKEENPCAMFKNRLFCEKLYAARNLHFKRGRTFFQEEVESYEEGRYFQKIPV